MEVQLESGKVLKPFLLVEVQPESRARNQVTQPRHYSQVTKVFRQRLGIDDRDTVNRKNKKTMTSKVTLS